MKPLPVKIGRPENPPAQRGTRSKGSGKHDQRQIDDEETVPCKVLAGKAKARKGRRDMVLAQQPDIEHQDERKQSGVCDDGRSARQRQRNGTEYETGVEPAIAEPATLCPRLQAHRGVHPALPFPVAYADANPA